MMKIIWISAFFAGAGAIVSLVRRQRRHGSGEPYHLVKTMMQMADGSWSEPVLLANIAPILGKQLVVAVRYPKEGAQTLVHFYGPIVRISEQDGIVINRSDGRGEFAIPPRAFLAEERKREMRPSSMTEVIHPDYSTLISLDGSPPEHGWNQAKMSERKISSGTKMFFGAPAKPMPEVMKNAIVLAVTQVPGICEAYLPQVFIESDQEARQILVVGVEQKGKIPEIMENLRGKMKPLLSPGVFIDILPYACTALPNEARVEKCRILGVPKKPAQEESQGQSVS